MTHRDNTLRRIVSWLLDEILDRDAPPGRLTRPDNWEAS